MFKKSAIISLSVFFILMIFTSVVKNNTRNIEKKTNTLTGASYYLIGCLIVVYFFDNKAIIMASLLTMSISDSFAAIIGIIVLIMIVQQI